MAGMIAAPIADACAQERTSQERTSQERMSQERTSRERPSQVRESQGRKSQDRALPAQSNCRLEVAGTGRVRSVTDGRSFVLDDGREIRLAGIEVPLPPAPGATGARAEADLAAGRAARAALAAILSERMVELRQDGGSRDRYGRMLAFVHGAGDSQSAAHHMLARGFARVSAHVGERACAAELWGRERVARDGKLGLWGEAYYAVRGADDLEGLTAEQGQFAVVEGRVSSVRESGATIYLNFGRRWSQALTVTISKRNERSFLEPKKLENRRIRVRGWLEERNGPRIEATRAEQIELAESN
jgi:endonuclease YncB( thermonuclease family)